MSHIKLRHLVQAMPHGASLKKRQGRQLKPVKPSYKNELWYKARLLAVVTHLRLAARDELLPELKRLEPLYSKAGDGLARDAQVPRRSLDTTFQRMAQRFSGIEQTARRLAALAVQRNIDTVDDRLKASIKASLRVDISPVLTQSGPILDAMRAATQANVDLITSIPEQYFEKLGDAVGKNMEAGLRFEDLAKEIERIGGVTESRAKLIARDQTGKMNSAFNEARQTSLGIDRYTWQTSGDERVREEHAENDGKIFSWNDPPATGHPGDDVNCRCVPVPYFDLDEMERELGL
ncbi:MAG: phage head morphogenesis protein [Thiobacillus sp.]